MKWPQSKTPSFRKLSGSPWRWRMPSHWPLQWLVRLVSLSASWRRRAGDGVMMIWYSIPPP